jgi:hypothetical protein
VAASEIAKDPAMPGLMLWRQQNDELTAYLMSLKGG